MGYLLWDSQEKRDSRNTHEHNRCTICKLCGRCTDCTHMCVWLCAMYAIAANASTCSQKTCRVGWFSFLVNAIFA